jgi:uncharacterized protein (DUF1778 family)
MPDLARGLGPAVARRQEPPHLNIDLWHKLAHIPSMATLQYDPRRSDRLVARITPEDKSLLTRAAALEGLSLASFVVSHIRGAAQEVIRHHDSIQLNESESRRFVEALLAPPTKATKRFTRALNLHRETVTER